MYALGKRNISMNISALFHLDELVIAIVNETIGSS